MSGDGKRSVAPQGPSYRARPRLYDVIPKLDIGNFLDVTSKLTILGAVIAVVFSVILKRRRLRKAIISDIKIALNHHNYYFTEEEFNNLNSLIDKTDNYQPVMITSGKPVALSNMTEI
jgi:hypothetical protein